VRIVSVAFETEDLLRAEEFYGGVLGLPTHREDGTLAVRAGSSLLLLRRGPTGGPTGPGRQHLAFTVPRLMFDAAKRWIAPRAELLRDADGRDDFETAPHWNAHSLYFPDPDGNILEFIIRRDIPDDRTGPFGPGHIQCISEVGIASDAVPTLAGRLESEFGVRPYGDGVPTFQPVGDVEGLLILVAPGRPWFPTSVPSGSQSLTVDIAGRPAGSLEASPGIVIRSKACRS
jgi:catechol 2,3-dioxygenase-like lactoylglutathione lyase family enzyme